MHTHTSDAYSFDGSKIFQKYSINLKWLPNEY